jgi:hypothetical protein
MKVWEMRKVTQTVARLATTRTVTVPAGPAGEFPVAPCSRPLPVRP